MLRNSTHKAVVLALLAMTLALGSCSLFKKEFILATGGTSGTYYPLGTAIADIWNESVDGVEIKVQATGASVENIRLLDKGESQIAIVQNDVLDYAFNGTDMFEGEKIQGIQAIGSLYHEVVQIAASKASGIKDVYGLRGMRVSIGDLGSGVEFNAKQILKGYGLSTDDMDISNFSFKESADGIRKGMLDACFVTSGVPNAALVELASASELTLLPVSGAEAKTICSNHPFYSKTVISGGSYRGNNEDIQALSVKATLVVSASLSEDMVYKMTKAIFENLTTLGEVHPKGNDISAPGAITGVTIPFHPGAIKYFRECGAM
ncbi:MAG: TAXI family TRAP transporter solute-binding subunit [Treponema sp.]|nr:TAXI family TRAP transporter solute-binding subunit [Treponema sp.]